MATWSHMFARLAIIHFICVQLFYWFSDKCDDCKQAGLAYGVHTLQCCSVCWTIDRLSNWVMYVWSRRANYFWCSMDVFVESASCEDTSKCLLRHFEVGLALSKVDSSFCTYLLSDLISFHRLTSFSPRAGTSRPSMCPAFGPGHMSGIYCPLVLWQAGKRLCPILVRRLWWQQKPFWHWGGVQKHMSDPQFNRYTLMIQRRNIKYARA